MNTFMLRMLFLACITYTLVLSGCGPKEIEPYQAATKKNTPGMATATTYPLSNYSTLLGGQEQRQDKALNTARNRTRTYSSFGEEVEPGTIVEEMEFGDRDRNNFSTLTEDLPLSEEYDNTPIVESLDAGSGTEQQLNFGNEENQSITYKKKYGRSSKQLKPVYFNFDQSNIRKDQISHIEHNGEYLNNNMASKVLIEGNCDEQGTNEYNLALGERRAMSAKRYLIKLGIDSYRIRTVSYGEERPLFTSSEEADYAYNRRDDFILE
ncbi:MAG: hypothetical protein D3920_08430 [Candidatus Electrothrix sp. AW2]|nr:hypothetical protein [Candidatus Electrothrix gigas]MCI5135082.1 hypothetical protein [Candidatus Electrothrix gigas]MCI5191686.1 hypothetical protein [Candidatus Electrothrix gigas]